MSGSKILKWITAIFEGLLGIPFIGGAYIIANGWTPLLVMLVLHIITLVITNRDRGATAGSILGIITSIIGIIPIVGMVMHMLTAIVLAITALIPDRNDYS